MRKAVIIDGVRTPIGRYGGALRNVRPDDLAALAIQKLLERNPIPAENIDDVFFGCANQAGEDGRNVARMALLIAGLPVSVPGVTVNRLCGSGLEAVNQAANSILADRGEIFIAGGVESMTRSPYILPKRGEAYERGHVEVQDSTLGWRFINERFTEKYPPISLGETAENVAERYHVRREDQDRFALSSQRKYAEAYREGRFNDEIIPVEVTGRKGEKEIFQADEHPRPEVTLEKLAQLKPAFRKGGTVTAGNSSGLNDGSAALLIMEEEMARRLGLNPLARIVTSAVAGVDPSFMGIGPVPATLKALKRAGMRIEEIDLVEINEAFAAQSVASIRELKLDPEKVNVNGGAIALGHPLGASGARIMTTLVHELKRRKGRFGLATMCIGIGQGIATIIERIEE